jgi:hypothetical protein
MMPPRLHRWREKEGPGHVVGAGPLLLVAPNAAWSLAKFENSWQGQRSERTGLWEVRPVVGGIAFIVFDIMAFASA